MKCQRSKFSIPHHVHYLNCAYMSPLSKRVVEVGVEALGRKCDPSRIVPEDFFANPNRIRGLFARLVNVSDPDRIALVPAVSYGMGIVARNTVMSAGQNLVAVQHQFPANVYPWRRLCAESGGELRVVAPPDDAPCRAVGWNEAVLSAIDRQTVLVALPQIHWTDGTIFDLAAIGAHAREVGAAFVVDGTQSVGAMAFDVSALQPDALVCAAYKWLMGPYATGVAYIGERFLDGVPLEETWIGRRGSEDFSGLVAYEDRYRPGAARFDVGENSNFALTPMVVVAFEQVLEWGVGAIADYCAGLTRDFIPAVCDRGYSVEQETWRANHLFGIRVPSHTDINVLKAALEQRHVFVSVRGDAIRISPHVYNDENDMAALLEAL